MTNIQAGLKDFLPENKVQPTMQLLQKLIKARGKHLQSNVDPTVVTITSDLLRQANTAPEREQAKRDINQFLGPDLTAKVAFSTLVTSHLPRIMW